MPSDDFLRRYWVVPSPEVSELRLKVMKLVAEQRHYATSECIGERDYIRGTGEIRKLIAEFPTEARNEGVASVEAGLNLLARMKRLPEKSDWSKPTDYKQLLASANIGFQVDRASIRILPNGYVYAEADECWYWVLHDKDHFPIGGNFVTYIVPYVLSVEGKEVRLYASGTPTASKPRRGRFPFAFGKNRGIR